MEGLIDPTAPRCSASIRGAQCYLDAGHADQHCADVRGVRWSSGQVMVVAEARCDSTASLEVTIAVTLYASGFEAAARGVPEDVNRGAHYRRGWTEGREAATTGRARYRARLESGEVSPDGIERVKETT